MNRNEGGESRGIDVARTRDRARCAHRGCVAQPRTSEFPCLDQKGRPYRLFPEVLLHDVVLNAGHQRAPETSDDGCVNPRGHEAKSVTSSHEAIVRLKSFVATLANLDARQPGEMSR